MGPSMAPIPPTDASPILVRSTGVFAQAEQERERIYELAEKLLQEQNLKALTLQSSQNIHPCWVKVEVWLPKGDRMVTDRSSVLITIEPKPFHRFELEYTVELIDRGKTKRYAAMRELREPELRQLLAYQLRRGPKPSLTSLMLRRHSWQLWKPKNRLDAFGKDWLGGVSLALVVVGLMTVAIVVGIFLLGIGLALAVYAARRPILVRSGGRPQAEPRELIGVDSWQAMVPQAGLDCEIIRRRFLEAIRRPSDSGFRSSVEKIWHWGIDGKVERDQIVASLGRALFFCHLYAYEEKLYVGWDSHLNRGTWVEKSLARGLDRGTRELVTINTVVRGWQNLSEYDVTDANLLTEWCHEQLVSVLKAYMQEKRIDAELDFKILRGERQGLTEQRSTASTATAVAAGWFKRKRERTTPAAA